MRLLSERTSIFSFSKSQWSILEREREGGREGGREKGGREGKVND